MSDGNSTYTFDANGQPPKTRDDLEGYIQGSSHIVAKLEYDIILRERKRQAMRNLLTKFPNKSFFSEIEIKKEVTRLTDGQEDFEHEDENEYAY